MAPTSLLPKFLRLGAATWCRWATGEIKVLSGHTSIQKLALMFSCLTSWSVRSQVLLGPPYNGARCAQRCRNEMGSLRGPLPPRNMHFILCRPPTAHILPYLMAFSHSNALFSIVWRPRHRRATVLPKFSKQQRRGPGTHPQMFDHRAHTVS